MNAQPPPYMGFRFGMVKLQLISEVQEDGSATISFRFGMVKLQPSSQSAYTGYRDTFPLWHGKVATMDAVSSPKRVSSVSALAW